MKIITRSVSEWDDARQRYVTVEEDSYDYEGPLAECKKPKAPAPPDPNLVAGAQTQQNQNTAAYNAALNRIDTYSPMGSQEYSKTGVDASGAPIYRQDIKLDPMVESLYRSQLGQNQQLGDKAGGIIDQLPTQPFSLSGLPGRSDLNSIRGNAQDALYGRNTAYLDPQYKQGEDALRSRLANQGVVEGTEAYDNAMGDFNRGKEFSYGQARDSAIAGGGAEADRAFNQDERLRSTMLAETLLQRDRPFQELEQLRGMTGEAPIPQFQGTAQVGSDPADIQLAYSQQYQGQQDNYNAKTQQRNALLQSLFGLGGAVLAR